MLGLSAQSAIRAAKHDKRGAIGVLNADTGITARARAQRPTRSSRHASEVRCVAFAQWRRQRAGHVGRPPRPLRELQPLPLLDTSAMLGRGRRMRNTECYHLPRGEQIMSRTRITALAALLGCAFPALTQCVGQDPAAARAGIDGAACFSNDTCEPALACVAQRCVPTPGADGGADAIADAAWSGPRSCQGDGNGLKDCGASGDCCRSPLVAGGSFPRAASSATVADFRLDAYEITVGRFRKFVDAVVAGFRPAPGTGKHTHLNNGGGLNVAGSSDYEQGWVEQWSPNLPSTKVSWETALGCDAAYQTWTNEVGSSEKRPITCITWFEAQAFCVWDEGFLPTEAEWEYAAAGGGGGGRTYPWGSTTPGLNADLAVYGCFFRSAAGDCTGVTNVAPVGSVMLGNGYYGQSDLTGNALEWVYDEYSSKYPAVCVDCATLGSTNERAIRSSGYAEKDASQLQNTTRGHGLPLSRGSAGGARCARAP